MSSREAARTTPTQPESHQPGGGPEAGAEPAGKGAEEGSGGDGRPRALAPTPIAHGASFGPGVYLTPDVELTSCYGFTDRCGRKQALYCLVAPGVTHLLDPASEEYNYHSWKAAAREALLRQHRPGRPAPARAQAQEK